MTCRLDQDRGMQAVGMTGALSIAAAFLLVLPLAAGLLLPLAVGRDAQGLSHWWAVGPGFTLAGRSLAMAAMAGLLAAGMAWALTAATSRMGRRSRFVIVFTCCLPALLPASVSASAWVAALHPGSAVAGALGRWGLHIQSLPGAAVVLGLRHAGVSAAVMLLAPAAHFPRRMAAGALVAAGLAITEPVIPLMLLSETLAGRALITAAAMQDLPGSATLAGPLTAVSIALLVTAIAAGGFGSAAPATRFQGDSANRAGLAEVWPPLVAAIVLATAVAIPGSALVLSAVQPSTARWAWADWGATLKASIPIALPATLASLAMATWLARPAMTAGHWNLVRSISLFSFFAPAVLLSAGLSILGQRLIGPTGTGAVLLAVAWTFQYTALGLVLLRLPGTASHSWPSRLAAAGLLILPLALNDAHTPMTVLPSPPATPATWLYVLSHEAPDAAGASAAVAVAGLTLPLAILAAAFLWQSSAPRRRTDCKRQSQ